MAASTWKREAFRKIKKLSGYEGMLTRQLFVIQKCTREDTGMYNILEKVFFGDTLVLKFRNIQFWNDLIIGGVKYMYEQDYIIRMNNEVIRTMVKLLLNKDIGTPVDISDGAIKGENRKILEAANGQSGIDNIKKMEEEILTLVDVNKEGALEKALVFYGYLNELPEDELLSGNYSHEKIKKGLKMVAEHYGILNVIDLIYR